MKNRANEWKLQLITEVISLSDEEAVTAILVTVQPDATTKSHGGSHPPGPPPPPPEDDDG